jgi:hypothetical protein
MEAARTSETSVDNYFTRQYIPEDNSELNIKLDLKETGWEAVRGSSVSGWPVAGFYELHNKTLGAGVAQAV